LPHDLPPWETAYDLFRRWRDSGMIECLHDNLREQARKQQVDLLDCSFCEGCVSGTFFTNF